MEKEDKGKLILAMLVLFPLLGWLIGARAIYHMDKTNALAVIMATPDLKALWLTSGLGLFLAIGLSVCVIRMKKPFRGARFDRYFRGTQVVSAKTLATKTGERGKAQVTIADVPVPIEAETTHFSIGGATGTGKSTIFKEMMVGCIRRGDRMVILDPDGEFVKTFYRPETDHILNPYDSRTEGWSFFNEVRDDYDFKRLAHSIVQQSSSSDAEEWNGYGRMLFAAVARKVREENLSRRSMRDVYKWTNEAEAEELMEFVQGTDAAGIFTGADRASASVRFVLSDKLSPHLTMKQGEFSLRDWLANPRGGNLYITWSESMRSSLKPLISCWTDIIFSSVLAEESDLKRRIWVFLDELESLSKLSTLGDALTKGRKKGLCIVTGYQSYTQIEEVYGEKAAETMLANHRTSVVLAGGRMGQKTVEKMAHSIGQHEIMRKKKGKSARAGFGSGVSASENEDIRTELVVLPSEIMALPNLHGYLAFPGSFPVGKFKLTPITYIRKQPVPGILKKKEEAIV
ncbi:type IV secretion system DNA-binding domain-containing protein [Entomobacter blattae]|uniref:Coupling protein TraD n=1 Tax=Entomobacter blattae TaxID=2762277 RepID=A0A7H1NRM4_9PROT|nr:type IV secretion system DNA-binding domain-containing protein [Entomobacter blattae]QNT78434.1 Coupling protein TraD [Entomobacter blattae]